MTVEPLLPNNPEVQSSTAETFYAGALDRIRNFMIVLGAISAIAVAWKWGARAGAGFVLGCAIAYLNFHWLKRGVSGLADRITKTGKPQSPAGVVARFLLRYVLMGLAAYVILTVSPASLNALFAGLFLPVAAIACEAVYEVSAAFRGGK
jgi:small-conductance mechanosensitive channel